MDITILGRAVSGTNGTRPWDKPRLSLGQTGRFLRNWSRLCLGRVGFVPGQLAREGRQKHFCVSFVYWFSAPY